MAATITHLRPWVPALTWGDRCRVVRRSYSKRLGRAKTMTTREFAAALGIPAGTYGPWESGGQPSDIVETAKLIASITGCDAVWLAGFDPVGGDDGGGLPAHTEGPDQPNDTSGCIYMFDRAA